MPPLPLPRDPAFDNTRAFLLEGYRFIRNRCDRLRTDVFETRLLTRRVVCAYGEDAARVFYHPGRFTRRGAMPPNALTLLQDFGSVQRLEGDAHRHRKRMFIAHAMHGAERPLSEIAAEEWRAAVEGWSRSERVVLLPEAQLLLTRAASRWAGIQLDDEAGARATEFGAMIEGAGDSQRRALRGTALRTRTEAWARRLIRRVRADPSFAADGTILRTVASHVDANGRRMSTRHAAVELLNFLRPTVAVARFIVFGALALHHYPRERARLQADPGDDAAFLRFAQEVRRFYPFFPAIGGRARVPFQWRGRRFHPGTWMLLDLYGTNHDERVWSDPGVFRPDRFAEGSRTPFDFVPQGGGDVHGGHRCPGEDATLSLMVVAFRALLFDMTYRVPEQDLSIDLGRMPAIPASRFVMEGVQATR